MAQKGKGKRKIPIRMCVGCRERFEKRELIRVVRTPEAEVRIDTKGKMSGRGAYVCNSRACLERAVKTKALQRALEVDIDGELLNDLVGSIDE